MSFLNNVLKTFVSKTDANKRLKAINSRKD